MGDSDPQTVQFRGDQVILRITPATAERTIGNFKEWLRQVNELYRAGLRRKAAEDRRAESEQIKRRLQKAEEKARIAEALRKIQF